MKRPTVVALLALVLAGCGYVGDPLPPALNIPHGVRDLRAVQRGDRIYIEFTLPQMSTENLVLRRIGEIDLRLAGQRVPVNPSPVGAPVAVVIPARDWVGREVPIEVTVQGPSGRSSDPSNRVTLNVVQPLALPTAVKAENHPSGIRVSWTHAAKQFRIYRRGPDEQDWVPVGIAEATEFIDRTVQTGKAYRYTVEAMQGESVSERSEEVALTPKDEFAPAVPANLQATPGVNAIELTWDRNVEPDLRGYKVYRAVADGTLELVGALVEVPAYSDRQVESGKRYRYVISSVDQTGNESPQSKPIEMTAP